MPLPTPTSTATPTPVPTTDLALIRGPYLQSVTTSTLIVAWETDLPGPGEVAYGETAEYGSSVADSATGTRHAVTLAGLVPYTVYHYRVESGGAPLSADATFRTAASLDQTRFTFAVFGDTRTQHTIHQAVVERIVAREPDFVLHTGDLVEVGSAAHQWETFFEIERELMTSVPLFPALGNHEGNNPYYFDLFYLPGNEHWYTFDYGNARFINLQVDGIADFGPGSEQYIWLEEALATNTQVWLLVYFHVPPYSSVWDVLEDDVRQALTPLFERYGVDVVFNGHKHNYERNEVNGVTYVVTAGGGAPLYAMQEQEPTQVAFALEYHFVLVEIDGHYLRATAISRTGEVLDEFERWAD
jgi:predicted phosphodiesterase